MSALSKLLASVPLALSLHATPLSPVLAQLTVFDPANYSQNLLTAARALEQITNQLHAGEGIALRLQTTQNGYDQLFPRQVASGLSTDDVLRNAQSRWNEEYAAFRRAALLQGQIADSVDTDTRLLG